MDSGPPSNPIFRTYGNTIGYYLSILLLLLLPVFVAADQSSTAMPQQEEEERCKIVETAFRHLISEHGSSFSLPFHFYQLCRDSSRVAPSSRHGVLRAGPRRDIDEELFKRLGDLPLPVKRLSECSPLPFPEYSPGGLVDDVTQKRVIRYTVGEEFLWLEDNKLQLYGQYYYHGRAGAGWIMDIEKIDGKWTVTKMDMIWIS